MLDQRRSSQGRDAGTVDEADVKSVDGGTRLSLAVLLRPRSPPITNTKPATRGCLLYPNGPSHLFCIISRKTRGLIVTCSRGALIEARSCTVFASASWTTGRCRVDWRDDWMFSGVQYG